MFQADGCGSDNGTAKWKTGSSCARLSGMRSPSAWWFLEMTPLVKSDGHGVTGRLVSKSFMCGSHDFECGSSSDKFGKEIAQFSVLVTCVYELCVY